MLEAEAALALLRQPAQAFILPPVVVGAADTGLVTSEEGVRLPPQDDEQLRALVVHVRSGVRSTALAGSGRLCMQPCWHRLHAALLCTRPS